MCAKLAIRYEHPENDHAHFIVLLFMHIYFRKVQTELFWSNLLQDYNSSEGTATQNKFIAQ